MSNSAQTSASSRIASLLDENSFVEVGAYITARNTDFNMAEQETPDDGDSTGIGLDNVVSRLELYYQQKGLVQIVSEGPGMGTEVIIHIPVKEEIGHVSDITGR